MGLEYTVLGEKGGGGGGEKGSSRVKTIKSLEQVQCNTWSFYFLKTLFEDFPPTLHICTLRERR